MNAAKATLIALTVTGLWSLGETASAQSHRAGPDLLVAAERSFSAIPFGASEPAPGLTILDRDHCDQWAECSYYDADQVEHYFWEGELVVKAIQAAELGDRPIRALGIGRARSLGDVVSRVQHFLPEAEIRCHELGEGHRSCGATLGDGWISLDFDNSDRLTEVRIDAYHFI